MPAMRAAGCRFGKPDFFFFSGTGWCFELEELVALLSPVPFQHQRQAIDNNIQETADTEAEQNNGCIKQPLFCLEYGEYFQKRLML